MAISREYFAQLTRQLLGLPVSMPWRGYGSAIFLELGRLSPTEVKGRREKFGEACVMIQWSWRVERKGSIAFGSWSGERKMNAGIAGLKGRSVEDIALVGRLPEISVQLSGGIWLHSFMTAEGKPEWSLKLLDGSWLLYEAGHIVRQEPEPTVQRTGVSRSAQETKQTSSAAGSRRRRAR